jgi:hypothetical protein
MATLIRRYYKSRHPETGKVVWRRVEMERPSPRREWPRAGGLTGIAGLSVVTPPGAPGPPCGGRPEAGTG